jgi:serine/threonine protein kinase
MSDEYLSESLRIERVIGSGAMALVLEVTSLETGRRLAAKLLHPKHMSNEEISRRFEREWEAIADLRSPHLPEIHGYGTNETGQPYILMELLKGEDLQTLLERTPRLSVGQSTRYVKEACEGLALAHDKGVVHRDLKPANLFISRPGRSAEVVKVVDFGIAKLAETFAHNATSVGLVMGTPNYMSPEQARSSTSVSPSSDVWALGVVLFELLTGEPPFNAETTAGVLHAILWEPPRQLSAVFGEVPEGLHQIVMRCLEKDPLARYPSARELAAALAPYCTDASDDQNENLLFAEPKREGRTALPYSSRYASGPVSIQYSDTERPPTQEDIEEQDVAPIPAPALPKR